MNRPLLSLVFLFIFMMACNKTPSTSQKLATIYKDKLIAYKTNLDFKIAKLKKANPKKDTVIKDKDWRMDKHNFFLMLQETNYYNLSLISVYSHVASLRPQTPNAPDEIVITDVRYKYKKNMQRKNCDDYIIAESKVFNDNWPDNKPPKKMAQLLEYYNHKNNIVNHLLVNGCY